MWTHPQNTHESEHIKERHHVDIPVTPIAISTPYEASRTARKDLL
jgi:hypothetical protein